MTELLRENVSSGSLFFLLVLKNVAAELATLKITFEEEAPWGPIKLDSPSVESIEHDVRGLLLKVEESASLFVQSRSNGAAVRKANELFVCFTVENSLLEDRRLPQCSGLCSVEWVHSTPNHEVRHSAIALPFSRFYYCFFQNLFDHKTINSPFEDSGSASLCFLSRFEKDPCASTCEYPSVPPTFNQSVLEVHDEFHFVFYFHIGCVTESSMGCIS